MNRAIIDALTEREYLAHEAGYELALLEAAIKADTNDCCGNMLGIAAGHYMAAALELLEHLEREGTP